MHASVRGQRDGCQHDAGSILFRCAHLIGVLDRSQRRSRPRHHRNNVPAGPRRPAIRQATGGLIGDQAMFGAASGWNTVPSTQIRWRMTAMRRARATIAIFLPRRWASWAPHVRSHVERPRFIMTVAAWHSARLRLTSPALVMPPDTSRSPDWLR